MDPALLLILALATTAYAVILNYIGERFGTEADDWTWLEVVLGVGIVLGFTTWRAALHQEWTVDDYQRALWLHFVIGGLPIILWHNWRSRAAARSSLSKSLRNAARIDLAAEPEDDDAE